MTKKIAVKTSKKITQKKRVLVGKPKREDIIVPVVNARTFGLSARNGEAKKTAKVEIEENEDKHLVVYVRNGKQEKIAVLVAKRGVKKDNKGKVIGLEKTIYYGWSRCLKDKDRFSPSFGLKVAIGRANTHRDHPPLSYREVGRLLHGKQASDDATFSGSQADLTNRRFRKALDKLRNRAQAYFKGCKECFPGSSGQIVSEEILTEESLRMFGEVHSQTGE